MLKIIPVLASVFIASTAIAETTVIVPYKNTSSTHFLANLATEHLSKQITDESFKVKNINGGSGFKAAKIFDNTVFCGNNFQTHRHINNICNIYGFKDTSILLVL